MQVKLKPHCVPGSNQMLELRGETLAAQSFQGVEHMIVVGLSRLHNIESGTEIYIGATRGSYKYVGDSGSTFSSGCSKM